MSAPFMSKAVVQDIKTALVIGSVATYAAAWIEDQSTNPDAHALAVQFKAWHAYFGLALAILSFAVCQGSRA